jgi:hypothetical protein
VAAQIGITIKEGAQNNNIYTLGVAVWTTKIRLYKTLAKPFCRPILQPLFCHQTTASRFQSTPSVPIYRRYIFWRKIQNIRLLPNLPLDLWTYLCDCWDISQTDLIRSERGREFMFLPPLSCLKPTKMNRLTYALIFVQKTIPPISIKKRTKIQDEH